MKNANYLNYVNQNQISTETYAFFDDFAFNALPMELESLNYNISHPEDYLHGDCFKIIQHWRKNGLMEPNTGDNFSVREVAMFKILTVLKKRGFCLPALRQIRDGLNLPMYENCSVLGFLVCLCRHLHIGQPDINKMPYLIIDGENRITVALVADINTIISQPEINTYSHIVLNMMAIFHECDVVLKISGASAGEFLDVSPQIAEKLYDDNITTVTIDKNAKRIHSTVKYTADPEFGERVIKYVKGKPVFDAVKATEVLDD